MNESCHTHERFMSHIPSSHITHTNHSYHTHHSYKSALSLWMTIIKSGTCMYVWIYLHVYTPREFNTNHSYRVAKTHLMLIFKGHFPQKCPVIDGSFAKNDLQLQASYECLPPCTNITHGDHIYQSHSARPRAVHDFPSPCTNYKRFPESFPDT